MKNIIKLALVFILVLAVLCGCADDYAAVDVITDIPEGPWERDPEKHWKTDANGEIVYSGEHELGEDWKCSVCGCEIIDWGDGSFDINSYDGYGNITRSTSYENGEVTFESVNEYFYNNYGNVLFYNSYENGVLTGEYSFAVNTEGYSVLQEIKTFYDDGSYSVESYNENGDSMKYVVYDENDNILHETTYEYELTEDGFTYTSKNLTVDYENDAKHEYLYNEMGDRVNYTEYNSIDMVVYSEDNEYEYDDQGRKTYRKTVVNGIISEEIFFAYHEEDDGWWSYYDKQIVYNEDGSYTVFRFDENDELLSEESFDANGNKQ